MKKRYQLENLCCANCAAKMERGIRALPGVKDASINFLTLKLTIDAEDARFDEIVAEAAALCQKIEPDCVIRV